jgi:hypothetical protein
LALTLIRHEVAELLADVNQRLKEAEHRLAKGDDRMRVEAAGALNLLRRQKERVTARLKEIDAAPESATESVYRWVSEEIFNLRLQVETWVARSGVSRL